jgi:hypothetical protein
MCSKSGGGGGCVGGRKWEEVWLLPPGPCLPAASSSRVAFVCVLAVYVWSRWVLVYPSPPLPTFISTNIIV